MSTSTWMYATPFVFERGAAKSVGQRFKEMGSTKVLIVCDMGIVKAGIADQITGYLESAGLEVVRYDNVQADPPDWSCDECGAMAIENKVDGVLGLGGGSAIDTAKATAMIEAGGLPVSKYFVSPTSPPYKLPRPMKPLIAIPTTAGTGSEVSPGGVITNTKKGAKESVNCATSLALVDPELTLGLPPKTTAITGIDALAHAVEALLSRIPNAAARILGMEAVRLIATNLEEAYKNGSNIDAREGLSLAASLANMSGFGPFCIFPHEIGMVIGAKYHMPHGVACSATLAESVRFVGPFVPKQAKDVAISMLQEVPDDATPQQIADIAADAIADLARRVNMPKISEFIKTKEEFIGLADDLLKTAPFGFAFSPVPATKEGLEKILAASYE